MTKRRIRIGDIVCVDVDDTLTDEVCFTPEECLDATPNPKIIEFVNRVYKRAFVVIYTARINELIPATLSWLDANNVNYHAFSNKKIPASIYLDDKALHHEDIKNVVL